MDTKITRRRFLVAAASTLGATVLATCQKAPTPTPASPTQAPAITSAPQASVTPSSRYKEAPELAELVKAGSLPPVDQRLPKNPYMLKPLDKIGKYGGAVTTIRDDYIGVMEFVRVNPVTWKGYDCTNREVEPYFCASYEVNDTLTEFTFKLREGVKWSDGEPFTTEDIQFWWEISHSQWEISKGEPPEDLEKAQLGFMGDPEARLEIVDALAFKFVFSKPQPLLLWLFCDRSGWEMFYYPKHYLQQFHPRYAGVSEAELNSKAKAAGLEDWQGLFIQKAGSYKGALVVEATPMTLDKPTLDAWIPKRVPPDNPAVYERNPYFWAVDTEGNQLPYVNERKVIWGLTDAEVAKIKTIAGECDVQATNATEVALYIPQVNKGVWRLAQKKMSNSNYYPTIVFNHSHKDPVLRALFMDPKFKEAVSIAINRNELNRLFNNGLLETRQPVPVEGMVGYDPSLVKKWVEYDPDRANALLDELGLDKRDKDGYRLRPDGKRLSFLFMTVLPQSARYISGAVEIIESDYWKKVGIESTTKWTDWGLLGQALTQAELATGEEMFDGTWQGGLSTWNIYQYPYQIAWINSAWFPGGPAYTKWYLTQGQEGIEPPDDIKLMFELYDKMTSEIDEQKRNGYIEQLWQLCGKYMWNIGLYGVPPQFDLFKVGLENTPKDGYFPEGGIGIWKMEQWYWNQ